MKLFAIAWPLSGRKMMPMPIGTYARLLCLLAGMLTMYTALPQSGGTKTITVKGTITNQNGERLSGVSVMVKGSSKATATEADGSFALLVPANATLILSHI